MVPAQILRVGLRITQTAELLQVQIGDAVLAQRRPKRLPVELPIVPRAGNGADVNHALHAIRSAQFDELVERPC